MKRRESWPEARRPLAALRATDARMSTLLPCINQVTTLGAAFDAECSALSRRGLPSRELWFRASGAGPGAAGDCPPVA